MRIPGVAGKVVPKRENGAGAFQRPLPKTGERPRILVIDDEPHVRAVLSRILETDYEVRVSDRARTAIELLSAPGVRFDLILCDIMMPELTGPDIYESVTGIRPDLSRHFAFMSGGVFTTRTREFVERTRAPLLDKPFTVEQVRAFVEHWLRADR